MERNNGKVIMQHLRPALSAVLEEIFTFEYPENTTDQDAEPEKLRELKNILAEMTNDDGSLNDEGGCAVLRRLLTLKTSNLQLNTNLNLYTYFTGRFSHLFHDDTENKIWNTQYIKYQYKNSVTLPKQHDALEIVNNRFLEKALEMGLEIPADGILISAIVLSVSILNGGQGACKGNYQKAFFIDECYESGILERVFEGQIYREQIRKLRPEFEKIVKEVFAELGLGKVELSAYTALSQRKAQLNKEKLQRQKASPSKAMKQKKNKQKKNKKKRSKKRKSRPTATNDVETATNETFA